MPRAQPHAVALANHGSHGNDDHGTVAAAKVFTLTLALGKSGDDRAKSVLFDCAHESDLEVRRAAPSTAAISTG